MKVLVTGGSGYLMSYFMEHFLDAGHQFWITKKSSEFSQDGNTIHCDLTNQDHVENLKNLDIIPDLVIHAAANTDIKLTAGNCFYPIPAFDKFTYVYQANVIATTNIIEFIKAKNIKKLIYISSQTVYGLPKNTTVIKEDTLLNPLEHYSLSKSMCENIIELSTSYIDFKCINLRVSGIYGGNRNRGIVHNMLNSAKAKKVLPIDIGYTLPIDIIHIEDVCLALSRFFREKCWTEKFLVFNCSSGESTNLNQIVDDVFQVTGIQHTLGYKDSIVLKFENVKLLDFLGIEFKTRIERLEQEWIKLHRD